MVLAEDSYDAQTKKGANRTTHPVESARSTHTTSVFCNKSPSATNDPHLQIMAAPEDIQSCPIPKSPSPRFFGHRAKLLKRHALL